MLVLQALLFTLNYQAGSGVVMRQARRIRATERRGMGRT